MNSIHKQNNHSTSSRRGTAIMAVLTTLVLFAILTGVSTRWVMNLGRQIKEEQNRVQVESLIQSGVSRAKAKLAASEEYTGETWSISSGESGLNEDAVVHIQLKSGNESTKPKMIIVQAKYPADSLRRVQKTVRFTTK